MSTYVRFTRTTYHSRYGYVAYLVSYQVSSYAARILPTTNMSTGSIRPQKYITNGIISKWNLKHNMYYMCPSRNAISYLVIILVTRTHTRIRVRTVEASVCRMVQDRILFLYLITQRYVDPVCAHSPGGSVTYLNQTHDTCVRRTKYNAAFIAEYRQIVPVGIHS